MAGTVNSASDDRTVNNAARHQYRVLTDGEKMLMMTVKDIGADLLNAIDAVAGSHADGSPSHREFELARQRAEEAIMWAVKGITR